MDMKQINEWAQECVSFQMWFKSLGGNIANNEQMSEAFKKIEAKNVSDSNLYNLLEANEKLINNIEVVEPTQIN